ncbi:MAG: hypothetical protein QOH32_560 [Bradyrhizobium sp.]|nr:hypothetical protein [Bradyrhizobium sp.]
MSEQKSEPTGVSIAAGPTAVNPADATLAVTPQDAAKDTASVESPKLAPERSEADKAQDAPKIETKPEAKADASTPASQILIMPRDQAWNGGADQGAQAAGDKPGIFGKRRAAALVAVIALATAAGAVGGALATAGLGRITGTEPGMAANHALEDSISRIDTEIAALRTSLEQASKHTASQLSKSTDRLDRVEKAQAEPAAKLAKLSETVEKLRVAAAPAASVAAAPVTAAPAAPKETTATIQTANAAPGPVPVPAPKPEVARLPTVEGWVLRDVANGSALIEGRQGIFEVYAGDPIPGLGRIDAIRKQDGRWVVVTSRGLIVGR